MNKTSGVINLSKGQSYTAPCDGYIHILNSTDQSGFIDIYSANSVNIGNLRPIATSSFSNSGSTCFVRKGIRLDVGSYDFTSCKFIPLDES